MLKIGVFGGSFDPCHVEHVNMARAMIKELALDKLIIVPAGIAPHKINERAAPPKDRLNMLKTAFSADDGVEISDYEIAKRGVSYSFETAEHFASEYPGAVIYFLVGTDMLADFCTWKNPERILNAVTLCVIEREGDDFESAVRLYNEYFDKPFRKLEYIGKNVSSTAIRAKACLDLPLTGLVDEGVERYIKNNGLYKNRYSEFVIKNLPIKRLTHTFGVMVLAVRYAKTLKISIDKAFTAAMLHDAAKYLDQREYDIIIDDDVPASVVHQFLGAYVAEKVLKVDDEDIVNAIRFHTTGRPRMSALEKVVFTADLLEQGRTFADVQLLRDAVAADFEKGFRLCVKYLYDYLLKSGQPVYYLTKAAKDYYCGNE